jgi:hypothetical protein
VARLVRAERDACEAVTYQFGVDEGIAQPDPAQRFIRARRAAFDLDDPPIDQAAVEGQRMLGQRRRRAGRRAQVDAEVPDLAPIAGVLDEDAVGRQDLGNAGEVAIGIG